MLHQKSQIIRRVVFLGWIAILHCGIGGQAFAIKPKPPLDLTLNSASHLDGTIEVILTATAHIDIAAAELSLDVPASLSLIQGEKKWVGSILSGEKKTITLLLQKISTTPAEVIGVGTVYLQGVESFVQQSRIQIDQEPDRPLPPPLSPSIQQRRDQERMLGQKGF